MEGQWTDVADALVELTPEYLTEALHRGGHRLTVVTVHGERVGTGQMGTTFRLALEYDGEPGPATLIAKVAGEDEAMRAIVARGYAAEVGFYRHLAAGLDVRTPRCWYSAMTDDRTRFTLLLDDISPARPGVQAEGCSVAQAEAALQNLVGLHAPRWGDATLYEHRFLQRPVEGMASMMQDILTTATDGFIERYEDQLDAADPDTLRAVAGVIGTWQGTRIDPISVLHGDYRLDNLLFPPDDAAVVVVDWQTAALGPPLRDVAYFLGTCLEPSVRATHEQDLVRGYHEALLAAGVVGYDAARCWDDYRLGLLQGPLVTVTGCMYASGERSDRSDAMFLAMARRSAAAIRDHRSLDLL